MLFIDISQAKRGIETLCYQGRPNNELALNAWSKIYDEFVREFGVSAEYVHYLREKTILCEWLKALHIDGEKWRKVMIGVKEREIAHLEQNMNSGESDFNVMLGKLSKKMGFGIDPMKTTVRQFYSYIKAL